MVTRTEGEDWIMLQVEDHGYGVREGSVFCWSDSFCSRMVQDQGPRVAPQANSVPAYVAAPIGKQVQIGAYVGIPMVLSDGSLFGTLCAIDPEPQAETVRHQLPTMELLAKLLSTILDKELKSQAQFRRLERIEAEAMSDILTELYNRRGWETLLSAEEKRCQRYGHPAGIIYIDLDDLKPINDTKGHATGDKLIYHAGRNIRSAVREQDIVARIGGDEFAVLGVECHPHQIEDLAKRIARTLEEAGIKASAGYAFRHPSKGLMAALAEADRNMYQYKRNKQSQNVSNYLGSLD